MDPTRKYPYGVIIVDFPEEGGITTTELQKMDQVPGATQLCDSAIVLAISREPGTVSVQLGGAGELSADDFYGTWIALTRQVVTKQSPTNAEEVKRIKLLTQILGTLGIDATQPIPQTPINPTGGFDN